MHILVTNDDGPPSPHSSPYVHSLVRELQQAGHAVSVVLPHTQRSWIGKAHMIGQTVKPKYFRPAAGLDPDAAEGKTYSRPSSNPGVEEWVLVDGTPASCVQIGLYHFFQDRGPIDLVVSGPNYGRNTTAVFALSSGTLGGALEAALCKTRSIALSYAFFTRNHDPLIIAAASRHSVRVIEALWKQWPADGSVDLYSVNVPLIEGVEKRKTLWTAMLQNYWGNGGCFQEVEGSVGDEDDEEERIREGVGGEVNNRDKAEEDVPGALSHKHFKWAPTFGDVYKSVDEAGPGNDGWVVKEGDTSVTPLKANFFQALQESHSGELQLFGSIPPITLFSSQPDTSSAANMIPRSPLFAIIDYEDEYVQPMVLSAFKSIVNGLEWTQIPVSAVMSGTKEEPSVASLLNHPNTLVVQVTQYEAIDFQYAVLNPDKYLVNSYMLRKALIRKHYLFETVRHWIAKHPNSILKHHVKVTEAFEVDYAEFLDDSLVEAWDLRASLESNEQFQSSTEAMDREWWILKPAMSDRGHGIRLFSTMRELQEIFDRWETSTAGGENENGGVDNGSDSGSDIDASHLRHFVAQHYIHPPLLLPGDSRKFHIRAYVLCVGSLRVYVYRHMLALFASKAYNAPWESQDVEEFLTNTCLQGNGNTSRSDLVVPFWNTAMPDKMKSEIFAQICDVTGELFEAASKGMMMHFQPLPNAFEVFGLDFLVDAGGVAWLLEVNSFPDFKQTGHSLRQLVAEFWEATLRLAVEPFLKAHETHGQDADGVGNSAGSSMVCVKEVDLGRRFRTNVS